MRKSKKNSSCNFNKIKFEIKSWVVLLFLEERSVLHSIITSASNISLIALYNYNDYHYYFYYNYVFMS